tara:strand:- start:2067 stop:2954 length:888 start_codon:yes stop_codon:yes gene_type:complete
MIKKRALVGLTAIVLALTSCSKKDIEPEFTGTNSVSQQTVEKIAESTEVEQEIPVIVEIGDITSFDYDGTNLTLIGTSKYEDHLASVIIHYQGLTNDLSKIKTDYQDIDFSKSYENSSQEYEVQNNLVNHMHKIFGGVREVFSNTIKYPIFKQDGTYTRFAQNELDKTYDVFSELKELMGSNIVFANELDEYYTNFQYKITHQRLEKVILSEYRNTDFITEAIQNYFEAVKDVIATMPGPGEDRMYELGLVDSSLSFFQFAQRRLPKNKLIEASHKQIYSLAKENDLIDEQVLNL